MLIFLDESFRKNSRNGNSFGVLSGIAVPEDALGAFHRDIYEVRKPYHDLCLREHDELKGSALLNKSVFRQKNSGYSYKWNLCEEILHKINQLGVKVFGVVCFRPDYETFLVADIESLDMTYRYLFERIDYFMRLQYPGRQAKLIFDDRGHQANKKNGIAITNFFMRSSLGSSYDTIVKVPFFGVSQANNYGLQVADLITTVVALRFASFKEEISPLWRIVYGMLDQQTVGTIERTSLKVIK